MFDVELSKGLCLSRLPGQAPGGDHAALANLASHSGYRDFGVIPATLNTMAALKGDRREACDMS